MKILRSKAVFTVSMFIIIAIFGVLYVKLEQEQEKNLDEITSSLSDYCYISCPNGNAVYISEYDNLKYSYEVVKYSFDLYESNGSMSYKSETNIWGNTKFYHSGLLSGSSEMNYKTDFPQCVTEINDSSDIQRFFYPTFDNSEIKTAPSDGGKIYISFDHSISYGEALGFIKDIERYGTVTWLWVDTYGQTDMSCNPITIQNPYANNIFPVHGIPMYYNGLCIENPLEPFLEILNSSSVGNNDNQINQRILDIKLGINDSNAVISEEDIDVIGMVVLPFEELDRKQVFDALSQLDNIKCCT
ncbi:MAG: hypothetical protein ACI4EU_01000 [Butyrivibrio sp.]